MLRYIPFQFKISLLWILSFYDIYICLHPNGRIHKFFRNWTLDSPLPELFYTHDVDDIRKDEKSKSHPIRESYKALGLGDFFVFNLMILFILQAQWSLSTKILVVFGCIISVQIGYCGTLYIKQLWSINTYPALPFPVVIFSMYVIVLDAIMC
ncbi:unnamed protein product [Rotaria sordida]|uniref:Uncharacterized protein n=1 Tax=Rotaria sordida TaxID=392033 RepID=A0A814X7N2_9BILA|nr:unnamed protein product [Rotaria sordida]